MPDSVFFCSIYLSQIWFFLFTFEETMDALKWLMSCRKHGKPWHFRWHFTKPAFHSVKLLLPRQFQTERVCSLCLTCICMHSVATREDAGLDLVDWNLRLQPCCGTWHGYEWVSTADGLFTFNHYWDCFKKKMQYFVTCLLSRITAEFHPKPHCLWYCVLLAALLLLTSI